MKLTPELITHSPSSINALKDREVSTAASYLCALTLNVMLTSAPFLPQLDLRGV